MAREFDPLHIPSKFFFFFGAGITAGTIASASTLFPPTLKYKVAAASIAATTTVSAPTLAYKLTAPCIGEIHNDLYSTWRTEESSGNRADSVDSVTLTDFNTVGSGTGKVGTAASFVSANSEALHFLDATYPDFNPQKADFSFSAWVNPTSFPTGIGGQASIFAKGAEFPTSPQSDGFWLSVACSDIGGSYDTGKLIILMGSTGVGGRLANSNAGAPTISTSTWTHVLVTFDRDGLCWIYINGALYQTFDISSKDGLTVDGAANGVLGAGTISSASPNFFFWDGLLDAAHYWKTLLNQAAVDYLYNGGSGREVYNGTSAQVVGTSRLFAPTLAYRINGQTINGTSLFAPSVSTGGGAQSVTGGTIASTVALSPPTLAYRILGPTRASTLVLSTPSLAYRVQGATISSTAALFSPAVAYRISGATRASTLVLSPPTLAYRINGATIAAGTVLNPPLVSTGGLTILAAHRASTLAMFAPTITTGAVSITGGTIASGNQRFPPSIAYRVSGATIASGNQRFPPAFAYRVLGASIASTTTLSPPSLRYVVQGGTVGSTVALFPPSVALGAAVIQGAFIPSTAVLYPPSITGGRPIIVAPGATCYTLAENRTSHVGFEDRVVYTLARAQSKVAG